MTDSQTNVKMAAIPERRNPNDFSMRVRCLELALMVPEQSGHHDVVKSAKAFEAYLLGNQESNNG